jgi:hypothetical protein
MYKPHRLIKFCHTYKKAAHQRSAFLCLPSEAGKPVRLEDSGVTLTKGKLIRMARASLANGGD